MTAATLTRLVRRRWYAVLLVAALAVPVVSDVSRRPSLYEASAEVTLVAPAPAGSPNQLLSTSRSLVAMAGLLARRVQGQTAPPAVSDDVDLASLGVREGWEVRLPSTGGQWEPVFDRPVVQVEVVSEDPRKASLELLGHVVTVLQLLERLQVEDGTPPRARISGVVATDRARPASRPAHRGRAMVALVLIALVGCVAAAALVDATTRRAARRRARRGREGGPGGDPAAGSRPDGGPRFVPDVAPPQVAAT